MYRRVAFTGLVSALLLFPLAAHAQGGQRPAPQSFSMAEAYAEIQVLKNEVAALQQQLAQQKAAADKGFFDDRFRLTAIELNEKQGGTATQLQKGIDTLSFRVTALEGYRKQDQQVVATQSNRLDTQTNRIDALTSQFQGHTHTYQQTHIGFTNVSTGGGYASLIQKNVYEPETTSPPK